MTDEVTEIASLLSNASADERRAFLVIARKVMSKGRESYGPTILANDARNFRREAADEITDAIWYWALDEVRRQMVIRQPPPLPFPDAAEFMEEDEVTGERRFNVSDVEVER